jgi:hypothetical protein
MVVHPEDVPAARGVASGVGAAEASGVDDGLADGDDRATALGEASTEGEAAISLPAGVVLAAGDGVGGVLPHAARIAAMTVTMTMCRFDGCTQTLRSRGPYVAPDAVPMG